MAHPEHWRELVDGRAELKPALDELWRWIPAFRYGTMFVRWAKEAAVSAMARPWPPGELWPRPETA